MNLFPDVRIQLSFQACPVLPDDERYLEWERLADVLSLLQLTPVVFMQLDVVFLRCGADSLPSSVPLSIADALHLVEAGNRIPDMRGIVDRFFTFFWKRKLFLREMVASTFGNLGHAQVVANALPLPTG